MFCDTYIEYMFFSMEEVMANQILVNGTQTTVATIEDNDYILLLSNMENLNASLSEMVSHKAIC